jgi:hypothetical protein
MDLYRTTVAFLRRAENVSVNSAIIGFDWNGFFADPFRRFTARAG